MKKSFFKQLVVSSCFLVLAAGCGKDAGSKGGVAALPVALPMNPLISPNMPVQGQQALTNLKAWLAIADTDSSLGFRGTYIKKTDQMNGLNFKGNFSLCVLGFGINCNPQLPQPTNCYIKNGDGVNYDLGIPSGTNNVNCTVTQSAVTKTTNVDLSNAVNGPGLNLLDIQSYGSRYDLVYGTSPYQATKVYTIDTSVHSILNPIRVQDLTTGSNTYNQYIMPYQF